MRVACIKVVKTVGPDRGEVLESDEGISVGQEFSVLSILAEPQSVWPLLIQVLHPDRGPLWYPAEMFTTVDSTLPSNWVGELRIDGSFRLAPEAWLKRGFWEEYFDHQRSGAAADSFRRELEIILRES